MSNVLTVDSAFEVTTAPANKDIQLSKDGPKKLVLDILALTGNNPTITVELVEVFESVREIEVLSNDADAIDSFTPGRQVRGSQTGKIVTLTGQRNAGNTDYLQYVDNSKSKFFVGEAITEFGLTGNATAAALAVVDSGPTQATIEGAIIADTTAVSTDTAVNINAATSANPKPYRARMARLKYTFASVTGASFVVRIAG